MSKNESDPIPPPPEPPLWFRFGKKQKLRARQVAAESVRISISGQTAAVLFDDLVASLPGPDGPLASVTTASFQLAAELPGRDGLLGYSVQLRGSCDKSLNARALLTARVGSAVFSQAFGIGAEQEVSWTAEEFAFEHLPHRDADAPQVAVQPLIVQVTISVYRGTPEETVVMTLDSMDLTAHRP